MSSYHAERLTVAWLRSVSRAADDSSVDQMVGSGDAAGRIGEKEGDESDYFSRLGDSTGAHAHHLRELREEVGLRDSDLLK